MTLQNKVKKYVEEEAKLLKKHKLARIPVIMFKQKKIPLTAKLASWILRRNNAIIDFQFSIREGK